MFDLQQDWSGRGATLRSELEASYKSTGRMPDRLRLPMIPQAFETPLVHWQELHSGRSVEAMGIVPLTWKDFAYYYQATETPRFSEDMLEAIRIIDDEFFASRAAAEKHRDKGAK